MEIVAPIAGIATRSRKAEHLDINLHSDVAAKGVTNGLDRYSFDHVALPDLDLDDVTIATDFLGWRLRAPLLISCMTGGVPEAEVINATLATVAEELGIAIGLGSARVLLEDPSAARSFAVRRHAPTVPLLANLGAVQLRRGVGVDDCRRLVALLEADGMVLHLNALQEALQIGGDTTFRGLLPRIAALAAALEVPLVVKEVGFGIAPDLVRTLLDAGVAAVDVAGAGGTSWSEVERHRLGNDTRARVAAAFAGWGIPTATALVGARAAAPDATLVASGGIRSGPEVAVALALGADLVGSAGPCLRAAARGEEALSDLLTEWTEVLRITMFCIGAPHLQALRSTPTLLLDGVPIAGRAVTPPSTEHPNGVRAAHRAPATPSIDRAQVAVSLPRWTPTTSTPANGAAPRPPAPGPDHAARLAAADAICLTLARRHEENFTVATRLLPPQQRLHLARIYAFCRITDDLGDETDGDATPRLQTWRAATASALAAAALPTPTDPTDPTDPVLLALAETVTARSLALQPFLDLIDANLQDQRIAAYQTWPDLEAYCRLSAAPVGRMVLGVLGVADPAATPLADNVCIGLQLANFAQDVAVDRRKGRTYLLADDLAAAAGERGAIRLMCGRAEHLLASGEALERLVAGRTRFQLALYRRGGLAIIAAVRRAGYSSGSVRPRLDTPARIRLASAVLPAVAARPDRAARAEDRRCAAIARREAANFYWGFVALPAAQRHAIHALYAFARRADDAVDDPAAAAAPTPELAVTRQRERLAATLAGRPQDDVDRALLRAVRRHAIPTAELDAVLDGVESDLRTRTYATWDQLDAYCRLVASSIGRMCVRVFGFTDTAALRSADDLGIALQLTNILRDVREDAAMGRVYLPADDLAHFGVDPDALIAGRPGPGWQELVGFEVERATALYASGLEVTRYIPRRSAVCVRTMAGIYATLLREINSDPTLPLRGRLSLPPRRKLAAALLAWR